MTGTDGSHNPRKWAIVASSSRRRSLSLWLAILASLFCSPLWAICFEDDFTYDSDDPYFLCHAECTASVPVSLQCSQARKDRICRDLCGQARDDTCTRNPINLSTGSKHWTETDYTAEGEFPLIVRRIYESSHMRFQRGFGANWSGLVNLQIRATYSGGIDYFIVKRENGESLHFRWPAGSGGAMLPENEHAPTALDVQLRSGRDPRGSRPKTPGR